MMSHLDAVKQAKQIYETRDSMTVAERVKWAEALDGYKVFSKNQITRITGLNYRTVTKYTEKSDHTGGNLNLDALGLIIKLIEDRKKDEISYGLVKTILEMGVSCGMLSRLTGIPKSTVSYQARNADFIGG